jgi:hypothetical protein
VLLLFSDSPYFKPLTGSDESKRTTAENLERQLEIARDWIHKQKTVSYG